MTAFNPSDPYNPTAIPMGSGYALVGPRTSAVRALRGELVTMGEFVTDLSEWGIWPDRGPNRPAELWVDQVHDACGSEL